MVLTYLCTYPGAIAFGIFVAKELAQVAFLFCFSWEGQHSQATDHTSLAKPRPAQISKQSKD